MKLCNEKGIRLITVFEDEWLEREKQVKNFLLSVINKNEKTIMGRKTQLKEVPKEDAIHFLEEAHIQGSPLFEVAFGLYHDNELIGITTGNKHHRQGHGNLFVLNRLAFNRIHVCPVALLNCLKHLSNTPKQRATPNSYLGLTTVGRKVMSMKKLNFD